MKELCRGKSSSGVGSEHASIRGRWLASDWWRALLLLVAILLAYGPVWKAGTIWDDNAHMISAGLDSWKGFERIWLQPGATQQYYPVVYSFFWVEQKIWDETPLGYHLVNVILHAFSALLLVKILQRLEIPGAWLGATLWALHPVQVESVAWISELKNVLSGFCYLLSAWFYVDFDETRKARSYGLSFGILVIGLLAKTVIATLPVAILLLLWWKHRKLSWRTDVVPLVPFLIAGGLLGSFTAWVERTYVMAQHLADFQLSQLDRCILAGRATWFYLGKLVWPHPLIFIYPRWEIDDCAYRQYLFPITLLIFTGALWHWRSRLGLAPFVTILFFIGTLFPALGFFDVFPFRYSFVADHFQYLACMGPLVLAGAGITRVTTVFFPTTAWPQSVLCAVMALALGLLSWQRAGVYQSEEKLWNVTLAQNPNCSMAHNNLGSILMERGDLAGAMAQFQEAIAINPGTLEARDNIGMVLMSKGQIDEAINQFQRNLEINPAYAEAHNDLGNAFFEKKQWDKAIDQYRQGVEIEPANAVGQNNLANALVQNGQMDEALIAYQRALEINPSLAQAHNNLGSILLQKGRFDEAVEQFQAAVQLSPNDPIAQSNLARAQALAVQNAVRSK
jgi:Flp pilus assembly protein TadD